MINDKNMQIYQYTGVQKKTIQGVTLGPQCIFKTLKVSLTSHVRTMKNGHQNGPRKS